MGVAKSCRSLDTRGIRGSGRRDDRNAKPGGTGSDAEVLARHLSEEQLDRALLAAQAIHSDDVRAVALRGLGSHLSPDQLDKALAAAVTIKDKGAQASVLIEFASRLNEGQLRKAFAMARAINDQSAQIRVLQSLAGHLTQEELEEAVAATIEMRSPVELGQTLKSLPAT